MVDKRTLATTILVKYYAIQFSLQACIAAYLVWRLTYNYKGPWFKSRKHDFTWVITNHLLKKDTFTLLQTAVF